MVGGIPSFKDIPSGELRKFRMLARNAGRATVLVHPFVHPDELREGNSQTLRQYGKALDEFLGRHKGPVAILVEHPAFEAVKAHIGMCKLHDVLLIPTVPNYSDIVSEVANARGVDLIKFDQTHDVLVKLLESAGVKRVDVGGRHAYLNTNDWQVMVQTNEMVKNYEKRWLGKHYRDDDGYTVSAGCAGTVYANLIKGAKGKFRVRWLHEVMHPRKPAYSPPGMGGLGKNKRGE
ncbi:hypothetical protein HY095_04785 [Candidatus Micrarchaeota archaeon]|nr:hypothetical protein [Candidatus Micrarchaeota archaeon]